MGFWKLHTVVRVRIVHRAQLELYDPRPGLHDFQRVALSCQHKITGA